MQYANVHNIFTLHSLRMAYYLVWSVHLEHLYVTAEQKNNNNHNNDDDEEY